MFTGTITGVGRIVAVHDLGSSSFFGKRLAVETPAGYLDGMDLGGRVGLNGPNMTVNTFGSSVHPLTIGIAAEPLETPPTWSSSIRGACARPTRRTQ